MRSDHHHTQRMIEDAGKGFASFVDEVLRGRSNKSILNASVGLAALEIGVPNPEGALPFDLPAMLINNRKAYNPNEWGTTLFDGEHPLFDFSADNFTLFGLDFPDMWAQFQGAASSHHTPIYDGVLGQSLAESIGLPDLPYGELAHFAHLGMALYDTGRTFQDVWREVGDYYREHNTDPLKQGMSIAAHLGKTVTHPELLHTLAARGTMLTVMGLLHPLGPVISIGVSYLCMHLVHSFFGLMERNKEAIQHIEDVPVLRAIYNATGIKEWAERDRPVAEAPLTQAEQMDPYQEQDLMPERTVRQAQEDGRMQTLAPLTKTASA